MRISHVVFFVLGAMATAVTTFLIRPEEARAPAAPAVATDPRIADLLARLDALETRPEGTPLAADPALGARLDELERRLEAAATEDATHGIGKYAVSETQRIRAVYLGTIRDGVTEAIEGWKAVAEGTADPERQAEAFYEIGGLYLKLKDPRNAAAAYKNVVDRLGLGTPRGQFAAHRYGLCEFWNKDYESAYRAFRRLVDAPTLIHSTEPTMRFWAATLAARVGDVDYARSELHRFVEEHDREGHEAFAEWVASSRKLLGELE